MGRRANDEDRVWRVSNQAMNEVFHAFVLNLDLRVRVVPRYRDNPLGPQVLELYDHTLSLEIVPDLSKLVHEWVENLAGAADYFKWSTPMEELKKFADAVDGFRADFLTSVGRCLGDEAREKVEQYMQGKEDEGHGRKDGE